MDSVTRANLVDFQQQAIMTFFSTSQWRPLGVGDCEVIPTIWMLTPRGMRSRWPSHPGQKDPQWTPLVEEEVGLKVRRASQRGEVGQKIAMGLRMGGLRWWQQRAKAGVLSSCCRAWAGAVEARVSPGGSS